jgi:glutamate--cysteine ligase
VTTVKSPPRVTPATGRVLRTVEEALEHVHAICFKTGPPRLVGAELEWTLHHAADPGRPLDPVAVRAALGEHAPPSLDPGSPHQDLPGGGTLTLEPGGQVEISTPPHRSLSGLYAAATADLDHLAGLLARHGLRLGEYAIDAHRSPRLLLRTPRYEAMAASFARRGSAGLTMMCGTAATQVCLDPGEPGQVAARWRALHAFGPVLLALFANSGHSGHPGGGHTGWASARMRAWLDIDPARTWPVGGGADPARAWARYALAAPLLCLRRSGGSWLAPPGVSFADWIAGAVRPAPTLDDLDYHLGTLFPPVRPRGYLEARFLDAQPPGEWFAPVAVLAALLSDPATVDAAREAAGPVEGAWTTAARLGLADPALRAAAAGLADLACRALERTDLTPAAREAVAGTVSRRLAGGGERE